MDNLNAPRERERIEQWIVWGRYALLTLALLAIVFLLSNVRREERSSQSSALSRIMRGDLLLKFSSVGSVLEFSHRLGVDWSEYQRLALVDYRIAAKQPVPAAIRRYAILRGYLKRENPLEELKRLTSPLVLETVPEAAVKELRKELGMWQDIYGEGSQITEHELSNYNAMLDRLNLGPVRPLARRQLYLASGNAAGAEDALNQAYRRYVTDLVGLVLLAILLIAMGIGGVGLLAFFIISRWKVFREADRLAASSGSIQHPVLWISFFAYMAAYLMVSIAVGIAAAPLLIDAPPDVQVLYFLGLSLVVSVLSGVAGLGTLVYLTRLTGGDLRAVGLTTRGFWVNVGWGIMGYAALLPILAVIAVVSSYLFRGAGGGDHPVVPILFAGGWLAKLGIFVLASILAPFFEEIFFRGILYNALRARLNMALAVIVSAAGFAIIHPQLPAGFLPVFGIGAVLAVLFEVRRSLIPSMVAHALNNTVVLLVVVLAFAS